MNLKHLSTFITTTIRVKHRDGLKSLSKTRTSNALKDSLLSMLQLPCFEMNVTDVSCVNAITPYWHFGKQLRKLSPAPKAKNVFCSRSKHVLIPGDKTLFQQVLHAVYNLHYVSENHLTPLMLSQWGVFTQHKQSVEHRGCGLPRGLAVNRLCLGSFQWRGKGRVSGCGRWFHCRRIVLHQSWRIRTASNCWVSDRGVLTFCWTTRTREITIMNHWVS